MNQYDNKTISFNKGLFTDTEEYSQPENTYRFALNVIDNDYLSNDSFLSNEYSNSISKTLNPNTVVIGSKYIGDNEIILFEYNIDLNTSGIFILVKDSGEDLIKTIIPFCVELNLSLYNPVKIEYRKIRGCEKIIYFTDNYNKPRTLNINRKDTYFDSNNKLLVDKLTLISDYTIPDIELKVLNTTGNLYAGSYNVSIQYLNEDLNSTNWINSTNTINIYNSKSVASYNSIVGSFTKNKKDENFDILFGEDKCGKTIQVSINHKQFNKDNFIYYRLAFIIAKNTTGNVTEVIVSNPFPINKELVLFSGNEEGYTKATKEEIMVGKPDVAKIKHLKQFDNRLLLARGKGKEIDWCAFQQSASAIKSEYEVKTVKAYDTSIHESPKSDTTVEMGFMGGEVYAFGIVYVFKDGTISPVYHIPGRPQSVPNDNSKYLDFYEVVNNTYNYRACASGDFWGKDYYGNDLINNKIRHHKFPDRSVIPLMYYDSSAIGEKYIEYRLGISIADGQSLTLPLTLTTKGDNYNSKIFKINSYTANTTVYYIVAYFYNGDTEGINDSYTLKDSNGNTVQVNSNTGYHALPMSIPTNGTHLNIIQIKFSNIIYPDNNIVGHYIVVGERDNQNRTIIDKGFANVINSGSGLSKNQNYLTHTYFNNSECPLNKQADVFYVKSPKILYEQNDLSAKEIQVEGFFRERILVYDSIEQQDAFPGSSSTGYFGGLIPGDNDGQTLLLGFRDIQYSYYTPSNASYINNGNKLFTIYDSTYLRQGEKSVNFYNGKTLVNTELDSQVAIYKADVVFPYELNNPYSKNDLIYVSIKSGIKDIHPYLENIIYYHTHQNLETGDTTSTACGDIYINNFSQVHSTFYKSETPRRLGETISNILGMAILTGIGVIATILTAGTGTPEIVTALMLLSEILIGTVGVGMEVVSEIIQDLDGGVLKEYTKNDAFNDNLSLDEKVKDDTLVYVSELAENVFVESDINTELRLKVQQSVASVYNNYGPLGYKNYLKSKFLAVDESRETDTNKNTQTLKIIPDSEIYKLNKDYSRRNKEKVFFSIPITYNCKSKCLEKWENRILWSQRSFSEDRADSYKIFLPNNYKDIVADYGNITGLETLNNKLYIFTDRMVYVVPPNYQERLNKDFVTFIGTGEFLSIDPQKIVDDDLGLAGTTLTDSIYKFMNSIVFIDDKTNRIYLITSNGLKCISDIGMSKWFKQNLNFETINQYKLVSPDNEYPSRGLKWIQSANGVSIIGDEKYNRIIITKIDKPIYDDKFRPDIMRYIDHKWDNITDKDIYNNSWTISFSMNTMSWKSFHSYLPYTYLRNNDYFLSVYNDAIWKHVNTKKSYCTFYNKKYQSILDIIITKNIFANYLNDYIFVKTISNKYDINTDKEIEIKDDFFSSGIFYNNRQCSGLQSFDVKQSNTNWLLNQIGNHNNQILVDKFEGKFDINNIRDYVIDKEHSLFITNIEQLQNNYYIDKILNQIVLNNNKVWTDIENFKGNYLGIRLFYDNINNYRFKIYAINSVTNYSNS